MKVVSNNLDYRINKPAKAIFDNLTRVKAARDANATALAAAKAASGAKAGRLSGL